MPYPWYQTVETEAIEQGDLFRGFELFVPSRRAGPELAAIEGELRTFDFVVMTQTCDIEHGKARSLLLCPWWSAQEFIKVARERGENWSREQREALRRGNLPGYHLLNETSQDGIVIGLGIVDFHEVYTAPTETVVDFVKGAGKRLRLCPPYKEHLAQAFARFFMRVGLPIDISSEKLKSLG